MPPGWRISVSGRSRTCGSRSRRDPQQVANWSRRVNAGSPRVASGGPQHLVEVGDDDACAVEHELDLVRRTRRARRARSRRRRRRCAFGTVRQLGLACGAASWVSWVEPRRQGRCSRRPDLAATVRPRLCVFHSHDRRAAPVARRGPSPRCSRAPAGPRRPRARPNATVVEYYRASVDHYFMTASPQEQRALDDGVLARLDAHRRDVPRVDRPGASAPATAQPGVPLLRPPGGRARFALLQRVRRRVRRRRGASSRRAWQFESPSVFYIEAPDRASGACPAATDPVYRAYDNRPDANHRYMTDATVRATMLARGWVAEGYGPQAVVMCAPQAASSADDVALVDPTSYSTSPTRVAVRAPSRLRRSRTTRITLGGATAAVHRHRRAPDGARPGHRRARGVVLLRRVHGRRHRRGARGRSRSSTTAARARRPSGCTSARSGPSDSSRATPSTTRRAPFPLVDNAETLLDIERPRVRRRDRRRAVGSDRAVTPTGRSWASTATPPRSATSSRATSTVNGRQASPKFLFGESYGTTRSGVLAHLLETAGVVARRRRAAVVGARLQQQLRRRRRRDDQLRRLPADVRVDGRVVRAGRAAAAPTSNGIPRERAGVRARTRTTRRAAVRARPHAAAAAGDRHAGRRHRHPRVALALALQHATRTSSSTACCPAPITGRYDARMSAPVGTPLALGGRPVQHVHLARLRQRRSRRTCRAR